MDTTTVAVNLAKSVFQLAVGDTQWRMLEQHRLTRAQFERWLINRNVSLVIMEACALANKLARICYATLRDGEDYGTVQRMNKKLERISYAMPA